MFFKRLGLLGFRKFGDVESVLQKALLKTLDVELFFQNIENFRTFPFFRVKKDGATQTGVVGKDLLVNVLLGVEFEEFPAAFWKTGLARPEPAQAFDLKTRHVKR